MGTTEDKLVAFISYKLFDACLRALSLAKAKGRAGFSCTCSILINGNRPFSETVFFKRSHATNSGDLLEGAVRFDLASSRVKMLLIRRAY